MSQKGWGPEKSGSAWKKEKKEFFVVLFCDLEGLLQQFVAPAWKIMHWKSVPVFTLVEILSEIAYLGNLKLQAAL